MMDRAEWEAARKQAEGLSNSADFLGDRQLGDSARSNAKATELAEIMQAKALALIALFMAELIEPPSHKATVESMLAAINKLKKGDDRGPGYSVD
jgi:hypothetical protein